MPATLSFPGVYIEEIPSGVRTITGVATSITAFIGCALRGPVNDPQRIQSFADFERQFGGLWVDSSLGYAIQQYFLNGGTDAVVVRVVRTGNADATKNAKKATLTLGGLDLKAANAGAWGNRLTAEVDLNTATPADTKIFNLTIREKAEPPATGTAQSETFRNVSVETNAKRFVRNVLEQESKLARIGAAVPAAQPPAGSGIFTLGGDGEAPTLTEYEGSLAAKTGLYALENTDLFNLMCIPPLARDSGVADDAGGLAFLGKALSYCKERRAMLLVDPPSNWIDVSVVTGASGVDSLTLRDKNAALFFPRIKIADPLKENRLEEFAPSAAVAGIFARTDAQRGVWKAPGGQDATLAGVRELVLKLTDGEQGQLNPLGVNCLRTFPVVGSVVWGSRTLDGADRLASEWKYIPVRRTALFLEESLYRGTQWVVFEPNDEPLWAQIRLNLGAFMQNLFRQGAFQGKSPCEAYFVKCDKETTTQNDINLGIVNIIVGFAPLKPAEFVVIKFQQMAGQIAT